MGVKSVHRFNIVHYFYAGCTTVAPCIKKEWRTANLSMRRSDPERDEFRVPIPT
jgi:hypothetical protein